MNFDSTLPARWSIYVTDNETTATAERVCERKITLNKKVTIKDTAILTPQTHHCVQKLNKLCESQRGIKQNKQWIK
ncbi:MAG: hypothetical protein Aseana_10460 [Candidatus Pelagadaptatus aseana]